MPIPTGSLKQRVTIKARPADNLNQYGEEVDPATFSNWTTVEAVYASVEERSAAELRIADADASKVFHVVTMRYREDFGSGDVEITAAHALDYGGRRLDIRGVRYAGTNNREVIKLMCLEVETSA